MNLDVSHMSSNVLSERKQRHLALESETQVLKSQLSRKELEIATLICELSTARHLAHRHQAALDENQRLSEALSSSKARLRVANEEILKAQTDCHRLGRERARYKERLFAADARIKEDASLMVGMQEGYREALRLTKSYTRHECGCSCLPEKSVHNDKPRRNSTSASRRDSEASAHTKSKAHKRK